MRGALSKRVLSRYCPSHVVVGLQQTGRCKDGRVVPDRLQETESVERSVSRRDKCRESATAFQWKGRAQQCESLGSKGVTAFLKSAWRLQTPRRRAAHPTIQNLSPTERE